MKAGEEEALIVLVTLEAQTAKTAVCSPPLCAFYHALHHAANAAHAHSSTWDSMHVGVRRASVRMPGVHVRLLKHCV